MHADIHNGNFYNTYQLRGYACHTRSKPGEALRPCHRARRSEREEYTYMIALYEQEMERRPGSPRMYQTSFVPQPCRRP